MKKGIICAVLALMVIVSMAGIVSADDPADTKETWVTYGVDEVVVWTLTDDIDISTGGSGVIEVGITSGALNPNNKITFTPTSNNGWKLVNQSKAEVKLSYVKGGGTPAPVVYTPADVSAKTTKTIVDMEVETATMAGTYKDKITVEAVIAPGP